MFNDPLLMIIAAVAIVLLILGLFIVKKISTPKTPSTETEKNEEIRWEIYERCMFWDI